MVEKLPLGQVFSGEFISPVLPKHSIALPTPLQILRLAVSLNSTYRNSPYVYSDSHFPCFSYHANLTIYDWNIKHLFWLLATCVRLINVLLSEMDLYKWACNVQKEINLSNCTALRHSDFLAYGHRT